MKKIILVLLMMVGLSLHSCDADEAEAAGHVKIIALDSSLNPITGATVVLTKEPNIVVIIGFTNAMRMFTYDHIYT